MFTKRCQNQYPVSKSVSLFSKTSYLTAVLLAFLLFSGLNSMAQRSRAMYSYGGGGGGTSDYGLIIGGDYDKPLSDLGYYYKAAPAFDIGLLRYAGNFTFGVNIGYHQYQPIQATSFYTDSISSISTSISNYTTVSFYLSAIYNVNLTDDVRFFLGGNFGVYYNHYTSSETDSDTYSDSFDTRDEDIYIAPRAGFSFRIADALDLNLQAKYNLFTPTGNVNDNPDVGHFYKSFATGISFTYRF